MTTITNTNARTPAVAANIELAQAATNVELVHGSLTLTFSDGETAQLATVDLSTEILSQALMHGLKQKLVDAAAIARNTETGASATVQDKKAAVLEVLERLTRGEWNKTREGGGDGGGKGSILFQALARMQPQRDAGELAAWVKNRTDAERAALMRNAKLLPFIQAVQAERAANAAKKSGVDSDALLNDLLT